MRTLKTANVLCWIKWNISFLLDRNATALGIYFSKLVVLTIQMQTISIEI